MSWTLVASAALALLSAIAFAYAARTVVKRSHDRLSRPAILAFGAWWIAIGVVSLSHAVVRALAAAGAATVPLVRVQVHVVALAACVGVGALLYYFVFLRWGKRVLWPIVGLYASLYVYYLYLMASATVLGVAVGAWRVDLLQAQPAVTAASILPALLLVAPPLVGALLYWGMVGHARDPRTRLRGRLIAVAILAWFAGTLVVRAIPDGTWAAIFQLVAGAATAIVTLVAYRPPRDLRRRRPPPSQATSARPLPTAPEPAPPEREAPPPSVRAPEERERRRDRCGRGRWLACP